MALPCTRALGGLLDTRGRLGARPRLSRSGRAGLPTPARLLHMPRLPTSSVLHVNKQYQRSRWILRTEATSGEDPSAADSPMQPKQQPASAAQPVTDAADKASQQSVASAEEAQAPSASAAQAEGAAAQTAAGQAPPAADQPQASSSSSTEPETSPAGPTAGKRLKQYADTYHQQGKQPSQQAATSSTAADAASASAATTSIPEAPAAPLDNGVPDAASSSADASTSESKPFSLWDWGWLSRPARASSIATQVALFVAIGIGYCAGLILWARGGPLRQDRPYTFSAVFDDVCGVYQGTPLRMKGVQIGQASSLATDLTTAEVTIQVNEETLIIPAGSHVEINHSGLFGDTFLDVVLPDGDKAPGHVLLHKYAPGDPGCRGEGVLVCQGAKLEGRQGGNMDEMMRNMLKRNGPARPWVQ